MQTYVALIRGINLAGRNKVSMADLRRLFVGLGHEAAYFEKQLGVAATTRNWKTVTKLRELASRSL